MIFVYIPDKWVSEDFNSVQFFKFVAENIDAQRDRSRARRNAQKEQETNPLSGRTSEQQDPKGRNFQIKKPSEFEII